MMYEEFVRDFAIRTKKNLEIINQSVEKDNRGYEITQMINSLLGLLIFPQQKYFKNFPENFPSDNLEKVLLKSKSSYNEENNFKNIIRHIRNSIAHQRLKVYPYGPVEIEGVIFKDLKGKENFSIDLKTEELKILLYEMCDYIIEASKYNG